MNVRPPGGVGEDDGDGGALGEADGDGDGPPVGDALGDGDGPGPVLTAVFQMVYANPSALRLSAVDVEGCPRITFAGPGKPLGHDFDAEEERAVDDGSLSDLFFMGALEDVTRVTVDWDGMDVPGLRGQAAQPGDLVHIGGPLVDDADVDDTAPAEPGGMRYGHTDFEA